MKTSAIVWLNVVLATLLLSPLAPACAQGQAVVSGFNSNTLPPNDDGSTGAVPLGFNMNLFGLLVDRVFVNNNGNVTFDAPLPAFTPFPLLSTDRYIIAPFFADVDTSSAGSPVTYGTGTFEGRPAFGVNWIDVDYFDGDFQHTARNFFQLIIVGRADRNAGDFDIVLNYDSIQWEAGEASGGDINGLGGSTARAGFSIGRGAPGSAFELIGSAVPGALLDNGVVALIQSRRGSTTNGRYVFEIRPGDIETQVGAITPFGNGPSRSATVSGNGRFVILQTLATNFLDGGPGQGLNQIILFDTITGQRSRISVDNSGAPIPGDSVRPTVSNDGNFVAFAAPLIAVSDMLAESTVPRLKSVKGGGSAILLRNLLTGGTQVVAAGGADGESTAPQISPAGNAIVLTRETTDPTEGTVGQPNIYVVPLVRSGNQITPGEERCISCKSVTTAGVETTANTVGASGSPSISADAVWVAYETAAKNVMADAPPACPNAATDIVLRNLLTNATQVVSAPMPGAGCGGAGAASSDAALDLSGLRLAFASDAPLVADDTGTTTDVFVFDVARGELMRASETPQGGSANGGSMQPALSGDGRFVAFASAATNLDDGSPDTNGATDLHVVALESGEQRRLSLNDSGQPVDGDSNAPKLNCDGSRVVFESASGNIAAGAVQGQSGVYQRSNPLVSGAVTALNSATWWNQNESGWGLFTVDQGSLLATGWFTYDSDGEPTWYLLRPSGVLADGSYAGIIDQFTGVPFNRTTGVANESLVSVGEANLRFSGSQLLNFRYTINGQVQSKTLTRFPFSSVALECMPSPTQSRASATNFSDLWWGGGASSGWGLHITQIDSSLFATWYTYDGDREAVFLVAALTRQSNGAFTGPLLRQPNGTPLLQINGQAAAGPPEQFGTATLSFSDGETGTFTTVVGGQTDARPITRLQFGSTPTVCSTPSPAR